MSSTKQQAPRSLPIRDHQRALRAHEHVSPIAAWDDKRKKAYGAICHKLPVLVHQAGLLPALHFTAGLRQAGGAKAVILDHLAVQLRDAGLIETKGKADREALLAACRKADLDRLFELTREVQRCLNWYKRFAHGILKVEPDEDVEEEEA